jgi:hypothetical protein
VGGLSTWGRLIGVEHALRDTGGFPGEPSGPDGPGSLGSPWSVCVPPGPPPRYDAVVSARAERLFLGPFVANAIADSESVGGRRGSSRRETPQGRDRLRHHRRAHDPVCPARWWPEE